MTEKTTKHSGPAAKNLASKAGTVFLVLIAAGAVLYAKQEQREPDSAPEDSPVQMAQVQVEEAGHTQEALNPSTENETLPRLIDLGADSCIPCKMMAPILEELRTDYAEKFEVHFIDVWKNPDAGEEYGVQIIPTQIFYDASGEERFRHQGFFSKEDILRKWEALGVELGSPPPEDIIVEANEASDGDSGPPENEHVPATPVVSP